MILPPSPERWEAFALSYFRAGNVRIDAEEGNQTSITVDPVVISDDAWWDIIMALVGMDSTFHDSVDL